MEQQNSSLDTKAVLFVTDDNLVRGLIAQINSTIKYLPNAKIYLVHDMSPRHLEHIKNHIYKAEQFDASIWQHLSERMGHVTKVNQGKLQVGFIEEPNLFYMDTDAIINQPFAWETPKTMTLDIKKHPMDPDMRYHKRLQLLREFVLEQGGMTEPEGDFTLFTDGAFFVSRDWMANTLRPLILDMSKKYTEKRLPHRWYAMEYFHAAICVLEQPVAHWNLKQALPGIHYMAEKYPHLFPYTTVEECDLIHFLSYRKPWDFPAGEYPLEGGLRWWETYLGGPVKPLEQDRGLEKILEQLKTK